VQEHQLKEPLKQLFNGLIPKQNGVIFGQAVATGNQAHECFKPIPDSAIFGQAAATGKLAHQCFESKNPMMKSFLQQGRQARCVNCDQLIAVTCRLPQCYVGLL